MSAPRRPELRIARAVRHVAGLEPVWPEPPGLVRRFAAERDLRGIWANGIDGFTWRIASDPVEFCKVGPPHPEWDVDGEVARLEWLARYVSVPAVVDHGIADGLCWLRTVELPGMSAVADRFAVDAAATVRELGRALRAFHDALAIEDCPFDWRAATRIARKANDTTRLGAVPAEDLVVCHGDACNPNFLLDDRGRCVGYVDVGDCGVADRWADIAPALVSLCWNFEGDRSADFLAAYGIDRDDAKIAFYGALYQLD